MPDHAPLTGDHMLEADAAPPSPLLQLYVVRHGETEWTLSGQHTGRTDVALTRRGDDEARALKPVLGELVFTRVFTSPRQRARRTCELSGQGAAAEVEPDLAEWDYGAYDGRTSFDICQEQPGWNVFRDGCPGGETPAQIAYRADRLIARLRVLHGAVALFSHGHFGCVLAARWIGIPVIDGQHFVLGTGSVSILGYEPSHPTVPVIAQWNAIPTDSLRPPRDVGQTAANFDGTRSAARTAVPR